MASSPTRTRGRILFWPLVLLCVLEIARVVRGIHSVHDLLVIPIGIVVAVGLIAGLTWPFVAYQRSRVRALTELFPQAEVWMVSTGMATRYLVVTHDLVGLMNGKGVGRTWPLEQVNGAHLARIAVGIGAVRRFGLHLDVDHQAHASGVEMTFPKWLGFTVSVGEAKEAVAAVQRAVQVAQRQAKLD